MTRLTFLFIPLLALAAFQAPSLGQEGPIAVPERFVTASQEADNVDSIGIYAGAERTLAIVTAKATDQLLVYDALTGALIERVGQSGPGALAFRRPNGIQVLDDLLFVVERDNHRVQILHLPDFSFVGNIGAEVLRKPYGLNAYRTAEGGVRLYVTDDYPAPEGGEPARGFYRERVKRFDLEPEGKGFRVAAQAMFGEDEGLGRLFKVESILADVPNNRLFVCDEQGPSAGVKIYDLEGRFTGKLLEGVRYLGEPEGLALIATSERGGYLISTDQQPQVSLFHVLDRETLKPLGVFHGAKTANTDGIVVYPKPLPGLSGGGMWAIHDDQSLVGFDWREVRNLLHLP